MQTLETPAMDVEEGWVVIRDQGLKVVEDYLETGTTRYPSILNPDGSSKTILFTNEEQSRLYVTIFTLATQKDGRAPQLYGKYREAVGHYLQESVAPTIGKDKHPTEVDFLRNMVRRWRNHLVYIEVLHRFFLYLDRYYLKLAGLDTLDKTALKLWERQIYAPVAVPMFEALLDLVEQDRRSGCERSCETSTGGYMYVPSIDADLVKAVTDMIGTLNEHTPIYQETLRPLLLESAVKFYTQIASVWISTLSFADYLKHTERALIDEEARCRLYLFDTELCVLQKKLQDCLLVAPQEHLLSLPTAVHYLLQNEAKEDLHRCFSLFGKCENGLAPVAAVFKQYVIAEGRKIVDAKTAAISNRAKPIVKGAFASLTRNNDVADLEFVHSLIVLHQKFKGYVEEVFSNSVAGVKDFNFPRALKQAFEEIMNREVGGYPMAAFLCTYADKLIRRPPNTAIPLPATQEAMEAEIRKLVELFTYLTDKDLFAEGYRQQLARRLIGAPGLPHEAEKYLVARLKEECGNSFSCKLEGMLADSAETQEPREAFASYLRDHPLSEPQLDFNVQVLTTGHWPSYPPTTMKLPPVIEEGITRFKAWYDTRTNNRRLTWITSLSQAIVVARLMKEHDLVCTGFQAALLLLFNEPTAEGRNVTLAELAQGSDLPDQTLRKQIKCLYGKMPVIVKIDNPEDAENPFFRVNKEFVCQAKRFKLPVPLQEEGQQKDNIEQDRSIAIEAAIVRVMKARKSLTHAQLISEVVAHLRMFQPQPQDIKKSIEGLLTRDFLARSEEEGQANVYTYVA